MKKPRMTARELAILSMLAAMMIAGQVALSPIPNIEPVSLLILVTGTVYGWKTLYPIYVFVLVEGLIYGMGLWFISYLYIWLILLVAVILLRRYDSPLLMALLSGFFGLLFGTITSPATFIIGGWRMGLAYIARGLLYDVIHCGGNFVIALLLYRPLVALVRKLDGREIQS